MSELLALLLGRRRSPGDQLLVVTERGVEIPVSGECGWAVVEFTRLLAEIDGLPEIEHPLGRAC